MLCFLSAWHCRDFPAFCPEAWQKCLEAPCDFMLSVSTRALIPSRSSLWSSACLPAQPHSVGAELIEWRPYFVESIRNNLILGCGNWQPPQLLSLLLGLIIRLGLMLLFLTCSIYLPGSVRCCSAGAGCATGLESGGYSCPNQGSQDGSVIRAGYSCFF